LFFVNFVANRRLASRQIFEHSFKFPLDALANRRLASRQIFEHSFAFPLDKKLCFAVSFVREGFGRAT